jgi:hypothetical protein
MQLIIDTHVHIYPCFDEKPALDFLRRNLSKQHNNTICIGLLVEPSGSHFLKDLKNRPENSTHSGYSIRWIGDAICMTEEGFPDLFLFPGRQIVTKENIEILCLLKDFPIENGLPAQVVINKVLDAHGVPVISWSPGKWLFKREKVVRELFSNNKPGSVLIGDTSMRPRCLPVPSLMKSALNQGFTLIAGSDALPLKSQEKILGSYGTKIHTDFDPDKPVDSLRHFFLRPGINPELIGKRAGLIDLTSRLVRYWYSKKITSKNQWNE